MQASNRNRVEGNEYNGEEDNQAHAKEEVMDKIKHLRETTAKYMGFEIEKSEAQGVRDTYCLGGLSQMRVEDWKPDENSSQADMVEDKLEKEKVITGMIYYYNDDDNGTTVVIPLHIATEHMKSNFELFYTRWEECKSTDKSKKLARVLALTKACQKSMK